MTSDSTYDLIVVGCGAAGLSAALRYAEAAAEAGSSARVAVLERATKEDRGGASRWTTSRIRVDSDGRLDEDVIAEIEESHPKADSDHFRVLVREAPDSIAWLKGRGVNLQHGPIPWATGMPAGEEASPEGGGKEIVDVLSAAIDEADGAEILYETEAVELVANDEGRVTGVRVRGADGTMRTLEAGAVVLASGGFEGNPEMLTRYLGDGAGDLALIAPGVGNNRGDGIRMAMELGADTGGQWDMFHGEPIDTRTDHPDAVIFATPYGLIVNAEAERFFDEGEYSFEAAFEPLAYEIWHDQDNRAYFIGDQSTVEVPLFEYINTTDKPPETGETLAELAGKLGLDPERLEATVASYNAATREGEFDPKRRDGLATEGLEPPKSNWAFPIERGPFIGYPLATAITFTFGGVRVDGEARVVAPSGAPIPGLYAAGEMTGVFYNVYPVGTSVLRAVTFGRLAGAHAARLAAGAEAAATPA